jgi:hypothetical protein
VPNCPGQDSLRDCRRTLLSVKTISTHRARILKKLDVANNAQNHALCRPPRLGRRRERHLPAGIGRKGRDRGRAIERMRDTPVDRSGPSAACSFGIDAPAGTFWPSDNKKLGLPHYNHAFPVGQTPTHRCRLCLLCNQTFAHCSKTHGSAKWAPFDTTHGSAVAIKALHNPRVGEDNTNHFKTPQSRSCLGGHSQPPAAAFA